MGGGHTLALGHGAGAVARLGLLNQWMTAGFALKSPALVAIGQSHLDGRQHAALEAHHAASVGFGRIPTDFEINALPTIGPGGTDFVVDGRVVRHTSMHGLVVDQS